MAKKGKKKKEAPPPPAPESEVELAPPSDAPAVPDGGASFGRWSLVTLPKRSFAVLLHEGGTAVMLPAKYEAFVYARERPSPEMVALQRRLAERLEAKKAKAPKVVIKTSLGKIHVKLNPKKAPISVDNFVQYVEAGFFDGTIFHRVIPGFMIQGGGLTPDMKKKETRGAKVSTSTSAFSWAAKPR